MKTLTERQVNCLNDAMKGNLTRSRGADPFKGKESNGRHDGQTIASLVSNGSLAVVQFNHNHYPMEVTIVKESDIVKAFALIGTRVKYRRKNNNITPPLLITGVAVKKGKAYLQYNAGSNYFFAFESVVKDDQAPGGAQ
jgi:hypothetical protein